MKYLTLLYRIQELLRNGTVASMVSLASMIMHLESSGHVLPQEAVS